jgi:hypothetical protein
VEIIAAATVVALFLSLFKADDELVSGAITTVSSENESTERKLKFSVSRFNILCIRAKAIILSAICLKEESSSHAAIFITIRL